MGQLILHKNKVYNIYSSIVDDCLFEDGLTLDELTQEIKEEFGNSGLRELPVRLERAHTKGTSSLIYDSLEESINCRLESITLEEFYDKYLNTKVLIENN